MDLRQNITKLFSARIITAILEFVAIAVFTQRLGTGAMGSFFLFQAVVGLISIPGNLGVSQAAERDLAAGEPAGEVMTTALLVKLVLLIPWIIGISVTTPYLEQYVGLKGAAPLVALGLVTIQARQVSIRFIAGQMRIGQTAVIRVLGKLGWMIGGLILIRLGTGPHSVIIAFIIGDIIMIAASLVRLELIIGRPTITRTQSLLTFGRYVFVGSIGGHVYSWMDVTILRFFVPTPIIGAYEIAWRVASTTVLLTNSIRKSLFPQISEWYEDGEMDKITNAFHTWLQPPLYVTIPALAGAVVIGESLLGTVFGEEAVVAYTVLLIFLVEKILRSIHMILSPSLFAIDKPELGYRGSVAAILVNLILNLTLIPFYGIHGAAIATTVGSLASALLNMFYISGIFTIEFPWSRILWSAMSSVMMAAGVWSLSMYVGTGFLSLSVKIGIGVLFYSLLLLVNQGIRQDIAQVVRSVST